jgi:hypothetical protein
MIEIGSPKDSNVFRCTHDFGEVTLSFSSESEDVVLTIERMMSRRSRRPDLAYNLEIRAVRSDDAWSLYLNDSVLRKLPASSPAPFVAEIAIEAACFAAASSGKAILLRGAFLEKDGVGLALVGSDLASVKVLALHLHARRWSAVSFEYGFLNDQVLEVTGLQSLVTISSSSIDQIPRRYFRAIEASRWYDSGKHLSFYAVDPFAVHPGHSQLTTLTNAIAIDGLVSDMPAMHQDVERRNQLFAGHSLCSSIRFATMTLGTPIASCDAIEHWLSSPPLQR